MLNSNKFEAFLLSICGNVCREQLCVWICKETREIIGGVFLPANLELFKENSPVSFRQLVDIILKECNALYFKDPWKNEERDYDDPYAVQCVILNPTHLLIPGFFECPENVRLKYLADFEFLGRVLQESDDFFYINLDLLV